MYSCFGQKNLNIWPIASDHQFFILHASLFDLWDYATAGGEFMQHVFNQLMLIILLGWSVCMYVGMKRLALFICISGTILWNLMKLCTDINLGYVVILPLYDFDLKGQTNVAYLCIKHHLSCISPDPYFET